MLGACGARIGAEVISTASSFMVNFNLFNATAEHDSNLSVTNDTELFPLCLSVCLSVTNAHM